MGPLAERYENGHAVAEVAEALTRAAETSSVGIAVVQVIHGAPSIRWVNAAASELFGRSREELIGKSPIEFIRADDRDRVSGEMKPAIVGEDGAARQRTTLVHPDGTERLVDVAHAFIHNGERPVVVSYFSDVTAQQKTTAALKKSEQRFEQLIEHAPYAIAVVQDLKIVFANAAAVQVLGAKDAESLIGQPIEPFADPAHWPSVVEAIREAMESGSPTPQIELTGLGVRGREFVVEMNALAMEWKGQPAAVMFGRDVTERRALEAKLVQAERLAALGTLAAGVAHEVNNPLSYIMLSVDVIAQGVRTGGASQSIAEIVDRGVDRVREGARRIARIVDELRTFGRRDDRRNDGTFIPAMAIDGALRLTEHQVRHRATLERRSVETSYVRGDPARFEQVLVNLVVNALHALPDDANPGTHRITIDARDTIDATLGEAVIVGVTDNGRGIPRDVLPHIFDPFFTTKDVGEGTGLGLAICHAIIREMRGELRVETSEQGTRFDIVLPRLAGLNLDASRDSKDPPPTSARSMHKPRVLIVDDEAAIVTTLRCILEDEFEVSGTTRAAQAAQVLERGEHYDVILCDLMMPEMSGMDLYERVSSNAPGIERRFVFMTGGAFTERSKAFLSEVAPSTVQKPFEPEELIELMRGVVSDGARESA